MFNINVSTALRNSKTVFSQSWITCQGLTHLVCWCVVTLFHDVDLVQETEEAQQAQCSRD